MRKFALVGLGRMGFNAAALARDRGLGVLGIETYPPNYDRAAAAGLEVRRELTAVLNLPKPRIVMTLLPPNAVTQKVLRELIAMLEPQDILIDAGNSYYKDTLATAGLAAQKQIHFVDVGNNNGIESARTGACYTVGCDPDVYNQIEFLLTALTAKNGLVHCGKTGSGHFVKAVHNAIEYGMLQAIAEGFEIVKNGPFPGVDLTKLAKA